MTTASHDQDDVPRVGDHAPQPADRHRVLYDVCTLRDREGRYLYVGRLDRPIGRSGTIVQQPWWNRVATIDVEHFAPGTTEHEARVYERALIERLRPVYNDEHNPSYEPAALERARAAVRRDRDRAAQRFRDHDGYTRTVTPLGVDVRGTPTAGGVETEVPPPPAPVGVPTIRSISFLVGLILFAAGVVVGLALSLLA